MDGAHGMLWFLGDLEDPAVGSILAAIDGLAPLQSVHCVEGLPERPWEPDSTPRVAVLHRSRLCRTDVARLDRWRLHRPHAFPHTALCYGPYVRYAELEQCIRSIDLMLPDATAPEALPAQVRRWLGQSPPALEALEVLESRPAVRVEVVSTDPALRDLLLEACSGVGLAATARLEPPRDPGSGGGPRPRVVTVWDVPVLDPGWPRHLSDLSLLGPVVALLGFADRALVELARAHGATACLDVPFDLEVLGDLVAGMSRLERTPGRVRIEPGHAVSFAPAGRGSRGRAAIRGREPQAAPWPESGGPPRIPS